MNSKYTQKIVTFGGGTGHFSLLSGLVELNEPSVITAVTGTWDNGGSSGKLRNEMGVLPSGDIRQCLLALMEDDKQRQVAQRLFNDRLNDLEGPLKGHAIGNLIESRLQIIYQGQDRGIDAARELFRVRANIQPNTLTNVQLNAETKKGDVVEGETNIDFRAESSSFNPADPISRIYFDTVADLNPAVGKAIVEADKIIFSAGDLYTSILPHLLVKGLAEAVCASKAKVYFILNVMTKPGETDNYNASNFVQAFIYYLQDAKRLDFVIANNSQFSEQILSMYEEKNQKPVTIDEVTIQKLAPNAKIITTDLVTFYHKSNLLRHDPIKLAKAILEAYNI